jgi:hypothetical protein
MILKVKGTKKCDGAEEIKTERCLLEHLYIVASKTIDMIFFIF